MSTCLHMGPTSTVARRHDENGWMMPAPKNDPHSTTLKWWEATSYPITLSMTTTINDAL